MISTVLPLKMLLNVFYNIIDKYALKMKSEWRQLTNPTADIQEAIYNYNVSKQYSESSKTTEDPWESCLSRDFEKFAISIEDMNFSEE